MDNLLTQPVFQTYAAVSCVLVVMLYGLGAHTARTRNARKVVLNPEDADINGGARVAEIEHPDVLRSKRTHQNLVESAVPFFVTGFLFSLSSPSLTFARVVFGVYLLARVLHIVFYIGSKQPFRTASFGIGLVTCVVMMGQVLRVLVPAMT